MKNHEELILSASTDDRLTLSDLGTYLLLISKSIQGNYCYAANLNKEEYRRSLNSLKRLQILDYIEIESFNKKIFPFTFLKLKA